MGPFGPVWLAEPIGRSRAQVLVSFLDGGEDTASVVEALEDRLARTDGLRHPFISEDLGVQPVDGRPALVGEAVEGCSLASIIAQAMLPTSVACDVARKIARALHAAWDRVPSGEEAPFGLVHGDLMPHHVWVGRGGQVKVAGFGLEPHGPEVARDAARNRLPWPSPWTAPESRQGVSTHAADVYALGAIFAHMLSGSPPTDSAGEGEWHASAVASVAEQVRAATGDGALAELVVWCLAFDPSDRPTAQEVETHLDQVRKAHRRPRLPAWCEAEVPRLRAAAQAVFGLPPRRANQTVIDRADELPPPPPPPAPLPDEEATAPIGIVLPGSAPQITGAEKSGDLATEDTDLIEIAQSAPPPASADRDAALLEELTTMSFSIRGEYVGEVHGPAGAEDVDAVAFVSGAERDAWRGGGRTSARDGESWVDRAAARAGRGKESTPDESWIDRAATRDEGAGSVGRGGLAWDEPESGGAASVSVGRGQPVDPTAPPLRVLGRGREDGPARVSEQAPGIAPPVDRDTDFLEVTAEPGQRAAPPRPVPPDPRASRRAAGPPGASESDERRGPGLYLAGIGLVALALLFLWQPWGSGDGPDAQSSRVPSPTDASASTASTAPAAATAPSAVPDAPGEPEGPEASARTSAEPAAAAEARPVSEPPVGADSTPGPAATATERPAPAPEAAAPSPVPVASPAPAPVARPVPVSSPAPAPRVRSRRKATPAPVAAPPAPSASVSAARPVPVSSPAPAPVARPAPAPEPAPVPTPSVSMGTVAVTGDAAAVQLVGPAGSFGPGTVPAGNYTLMVSFSAGAPPTQQGPVTIREGSPVEITCKASFLLCKVR